MRSMFALWGRFRLFTNAAQAPLLLSTRVLCFPLWLRTTRGQLAPLAICLSLECACPCAPRALPSPRLVLMLVGHLLVRGPHSEGAGLPTDCWLRSPCVPHGGQRPQRSQPPAWKSHGPWSLRGSGEGACAAPRWRSGRAGCGPGHLAQRLGPRPCHLLQGTSCSPRE